MGLFDKKKAQQQQAQQAPIVQPGLFAWTDGYYDMPLLVHQCMTRNTVALYGDMDFQEAVTKLPVMTRIEFKMEKANKKNTPSNLFFDKGDVNVYSPAGEFVGKIAAYKFEKYGMKTGKAFGFVEPPSYDRAEGIEITPFYRVFIYCDYFSITNEANGTVGFI